MPGPSRCVWMLAGVNSAHRAAPLWAKCVPIRNCDVNSKSSIREPFMKKFVAILSLAVLTLPPLGRASAQATQGAMVAPGDAVMGHVHLLVSDIDANKKFWVQMGGTPLTLG